MAIQWDSVLVRALTGELHERLAGRRLRSVFLDYGAPSLTLYFRDVTLTARLHPARGDLVLLGAADPPDGTRPLAATLRAIRAGPDDRVIRLELERVRGRPARMDVMIELMTNQWNALVIESSSRVVRHALRTRTGGRRPIRVGSPYTESEGSKRLGAEAPVELSEWRDRLAETAEGDLRGSLLRTFAYTSPLNVPSILTPHGDRGIDLDAAYAVWRRLRDGNERDPRVLETERGPQPYPMPLAHVPGHPTPSVLEALERVGERLDQESGVDASLVPSAVVAALDAALVRAHRRVDVLAAQLRGAGDPVGLRAAGDLLLARLGQVRPGAAAVELEGFDGVPVRVVLDPSKNPAENADEYYRRAARAERTLERVPELMAEARGRADALEELMERARLGDADAEELQPFVEAAGGPRAGAPASTAPALPYRRYRSSGGLEIRVGRGARSNDDLTFHHAAPDDVWLHARHASGAHVVLRWQQPGNPPARDLEEAAVLAAVHSKARTSGSVPVDWTRRKYVRKPRKAPPGQVSVERVKTLFVTPDAERAERLATGDDAG